MKLFWRGHCASVSEPSVSSKRRTKLASVKRVTDTPSLPYEALLAMHGTLLQTGDGYARFGDAVAGAHGEGVEGLLLVGREAGIAQPARGGEGVGLGEVGGRAVDGVLVHGDAGLKGRVSLGVLEEGTGRDGGTHVSWDPVPADGVAAKGDDAGLAGQRDGVDAPCFVDDGGEVG